MHTPSEQRCTDETDNKLTESGISVTCSLYMELVTCLRDGFLCSYGFQFCHAGIWASSLGFGSTKKLESISRQ
jgi:hypothetical protein